MSEKKVRLNLDDLKVQSFVTIIDPKEQAAMFGRDTGPWLCGGPGSGPATCGTGRRDCGTGGSCYDTEFGCSTSSGCTGNYCQTGGGSACDYTYDLGCPPTSNC